MKKEDTHSFVEDAEALLLSGKYDGVEELIKNYSSKESLEHTYITAKYAFMQHDYTKSISLLEGLKSSLNSPLNYDIYALLSMSYYFVGKEFRSLYFMKKAESAFELKNASTIESMAFVQAIDHLGDPYNAIVGKMTNKDFVNVEDTLILLSKEFPDDLEVLALWTWYYVSVSNPEQSFQKMGEYLSKAKKIEGWEEHYCLIYHNAVYYHSIGDKIQTREYLLRSLEINPDFSVAKKHLDNLEFMPERIFGAKDTLG